MVDPGYRIHVVAELTGLSEGLIRAWERRYGVLRPKRTGSGYRLYSETDVEILRRLKRMTMEGISIAEAAKMVPDIRRSLKQAAPQRSSTPEPPASPEVVGQLDRQKSRVLSAIEAYDQLAIEQTFDEALAALPPLVVHEQLFMPLLREVGQRWHEGGLAIGQEHLVSHAIRMRLLSLIHGSPKGSRRHVICACLPHDEHEAGLLGAALRFRHAGYRVTYLGPRTPLEELASVARAVTPDLVAVSAVNEPADGSLPSVLTELAKLLVPLVRTVIGGPAAEARRELCLRLKLELIESSEDWARLLV